MIQSENAELAAKMREMADLLAAQQADNFRVVAYRRAAEKLDALETPIHALFESEGPKALESLPAIGRGIASALVELITTGRWSALDRLSGELQPELLFQTIPGIGPDLARRIHDDIHVDTLEALEAAAHDGRLESVVGIGVRRASLIRAILKERLDVRHFRPIRQGPLPAVADLMDVDREYREKAEAGLLQTIAPKRLNPSGKSWLPILHTSRGSWTFTALFSNSHRAHELGRTHDWVVIYAHPDDGPEIQCTVVTEYRGPIAEKRVVRGREGECIAYYAGLDA